MYPLDDRGAARLVVPKPPPGGADPHRKQLTYYPGAVRLAETAAPTTKNRSHRISAFITQPGDGALLALGGQSAGSVLCVKNRKPTYHHNWFGRERTVIESTTPYGASTVAFEFLYDGGGAGKGGDAILLLDGVEFARKRIEHTVPGRFGIDTFGVGCDTGSPVSPDYHPPFPFTGVIGRVEIELGAAGLSEDRERMLHARFKAGKDY